MEFSVREIAITKDDSFVNDVLERKRVVISAYAPVQNVAPPFVVCIDAPWGLGKTTFLRRCAAYLESIRMRKTSHSMRGNLTSSQTRWWRLRQLANT